MKKQRYSLRAKTRAFPFQELKAFKYRNSSIVDKDDLNHPIKAGMDMIRLKEYRNKMAGYSVLSPAGIIDSSVSSCDTEESDVILHSPPKGPHKPVICRKNRFTEEGYI